MYFLLFLLWFFDLGRWKPACLAFVCNILLKLVLCNPTPIQWFQFRWPADVIPEIQKLSVTLHSWILSEIKILYLLFKFLCTFFNTDLSAASQTPLCPMMLGSAHRNRRGFFLKDIERKETNFACKIKDINWKFRQERQGPYVSKLYQNFILFYIRYRYSFRNV
jgi:hypothetical protein